MAQIRQVTLATAAAFKTVRLRALKDSPFAFGSTYEKESALSEAEWTQRVMDRDGARSITFLAWNANHPCGIAAGFLDGEAPSNAHLVSVWVEPEFRKIGVGKLLIESIVGWARSRDVHHLYLMVTSNNPIATRFYSTLGFSMTGTTEPYPNDTNFVENEMVLSL